MTKELLEQHITVFDLKRLESYARNLVDFHLIMDLVPTIAKLHFLVLPQGVLTLSYVQAALLVGMGLQFKTIDQMTEDLKLQANQLLPVFNKAIRKFAKLFKEVFEHEIATQMQSEVKGAAAEIAKNKEAASLIKESLNEELGGADNALAAELKAEKTDFIKKHGIKKNQAALIEGISLKDSTVVSIPRGRKPSDDEDASIEKLEHKMRSSTDKKKGGKGSKEKGQFN